MEGVLAGLLGGLSAGAGAEANYYADEIKQRRLENFEALKQKYARENALLESNEQVANQEYLNEQTSELTEQRNKSQFDRDMDKMREEYKLKKELALLKSRGEGGISSNLKDMLKAKSKNWGEKIKRYQDEYKTKYGNEMAGDVPSLDDFMYYKTGRKDWQELTDPYYVLQVETLKQEDPDSYLNVVLRNYDMPIKKGGKYFTNNVMDTIRNLRRDELGKVLPYDKLPEEKVNQIEKLVLQTINNAGNPKQAKKELGILEKKGWIGGPIVKQAQSLADEMLSPKPKGMTSKVTTAVTKKPLVRDISAGRGVYNTTPSPSASANVPGAINKIMNYMYSVPK